MRNGLRNPYAMIRRAFASLSAWFAFVGQPAPVAGSIRKTVPSRPVGSLRVRMSWARSEPPSADGGVGATPTPPGGSPHGLTGVGVFCREPPNSP